MLDSVRIVEVGETSEKFFRRFTGGVSFGTIYSKGNQSTQYSISGLAAYPRERWAVQVGLRSNLSKATGAVTSTRNQVTFGGMHLLPWRNYFYGAYGGFLQSTEQGIGLQSTAGGGIGRYFKNTNRATISVLGGFGWLNTRYNPTVPPIPTQNVAAAMINADVKLFTFNKRVSTSTLLFFLLFPNPVACMLRPTHPTTSSSSGIFRGISPSMVTGIPGHPATYREATMARPRD